MIPTAYTGRHRANVDTVTAPANPWRYVPTHRANVTPRPADVAGERAAHRHAARTARTGNDWGTAPTPLTTAEYARQAWGPRTA